MNRDEGVMELLQPEYRTPERISEYVRIKVSEQLRRKRISRKKFAEVSGLDIFVPNNPVAYLKDVLSGKRPITQRMASIFSCGLDLTLDNSDVSLFPYRDDITREQVERVIGRGIEYEVWESQIGLLGIELIEKIFPEN